MLCEKCQSRAATVHITTIMDEKMARHDFCPNCAPIGNDGMPAANLSQHLGHLDPAETACARLAENSPYKAEAFVFVAVALSHARTQLDCPSQSHVSSAELLEAFKRLAIDLFGKGAKTKLASWGIFRTEDIGDVVFRLGEANPFEKSSQIARDDFHDSYNFNKAFPED